MSLLALQRDIRAWLASDDERAASRIGQKAARTGLHVYQNNYRSQLAACLQTTFARTLAWMGPEAFMAAATAHIERTPPSSWTLDVYGRDFPRTLADLFPHDPEMAELAWIEQALDRAFIAPDASPLSTPDLTDVDWDEVVLQLTPSLDLACFTTNASAIWMALVEEAPPPMAEDLVRTGPILVWRQGEAPRMRTTDRHEHDALAAARSGVTFATLCRNAEADFGDDGVNRIGGWLGAWIRDGLIVGATATSDSAIPDAPSRSRRYREL